MELPYLTAQLNGIGGRLRATPDHFVVEELPLYQPQDEGSHLYLNVTKVGLTTRHLVNQLERILRVQRGEVGYAGLKDKQARTTQTFSVPLAKPSAETIEATITQVKAALPIGVNWARLHRNKLKTGHLLGNHFRITICDLAQPPAEIMANAQAIAAAIRQRGIPNYFGQQRFGNDGNNAEQGFALLQGTRTRCEPWLRKFLISSYQSLLCNRYLALRLCEGFFDQILLGDVAKKHATGGMFEVSDPVLDQARFAAREISFTAPLYGYKMPVATGAAGQLEEKILSESGLSAEQWRKARVEGSRRLGRLLIDDLALEGSNDQLVLSFSLPKGAFATTVLREFMKNDEVDQPNNEEEDFPE